MINKVLGDSTEPTPTPDRQTVKAYLEDWLENVIRPNREPVTYEDYLKVVTLWIVPYVGDILLAKLTARDVQAMVNALVARKLSPKSIKIARGVLSIALNRAVAEQLIGLNVVPLAKGPRVPKRKPGLWTPEEALTFLAACRGHRLEALFLVALAIGLRRGEVIGLRWQDIDLDRGRLTVAQARKRALGVEYDGPPKTEAGLRDVLLPRFAVAALVSHRERQAIEREQAGDHWQISDRVFTGLLGEPLSMDAPRYFFQQIAARAGVTRIRFHDLRHNCATLLLAQGVPMKIVQELLGHSQMRLTADLYTHVLPALNHAAIAELDRLLKAAPDADRQEPQPTTSTPPEPA